MIRLLLVEDDDDTRIGLMEYIPWRELGVDEVVTSEDGEEALKTAVQIKPDIVLTDVRMPRLDGIQLSIKLRALFPHCIIIFLSGYSDKEYLKSAISIKALNYVEKPVDIDEIKVVVLEAVNLCIKENEKISNAEKMAEVVTHTLDLVKQNLALELTIKNNNKNIYQELALAKINFPHEGKYVTILGKLDESSLITNLPLYSNSVINLLKKAFQEICLDYLVAIKNDYDIIMHLCSIDAIEENVLKSVLQEVVHLLGNNYNSTPPVFFSVGTSVTGINRIWESYQFAVIATQELFFAGYGKIAFYTKNRSKITNYDASLTEKFGNLLKEDKEAEALTFIDMLYSSIKSDSNTLINHVKNMFFSLSLQIMKVADERDVEEFKSSGGSEEFLWEQFYSLNTLDAIKSYLHERIKTYFSCIKGKSEKSKLVREIISYIQKNYNNKKVSIKNISHEIYLTPSYLCFIFKNETGKTVNQYITEYRMNKAKELLKNRQIKLLEIANEIGYVDANYFTRLFKKSVGVTPSEYREKYLL